MVRIPGTYPANMLGAYFAVTCVAKTNSPISDPLLRRAQNFTIGPFEFQKDEDKVNTPDYTTYDITNENFQFSQIIAIDTLLECGL